MKYKLNLTIGLFCILTVTHVASQTTTWWPLNGIVILAGGNLSDSAALNLEKRLVTFGGGSNASIVIIPTANPKFTTTELDNLKKQFESCGASKVSILPTVEERKDSPLSARP